MATLGFSETWYNEARYWYYDDVMAHSHFFPDYWIIWEEWSVYQNLFHQARYTSPTCRGRAPDVIWPAYKPAVRDHREHSSYKPYSLIAITLMAISLYTCNRCFDGQYLLLSWALSRGCTASIRHAMIPSKLLLDFRKQTISSWRAAVTKIHPIVSKRRCVLKWFQGAVY